MATTDPLQLLANTLSQLGAPAITLAPQPQAAVVAAPNQQTQTTASRRQPVSNNADVLGSIQAIQNLGTVAAPAPVTAQPIGAQEQQLLDRSVGRSTTQQVRQQNFDRQLSQLIETATGPTLGGRQFLQARDARRLAIAMLGSGGLTGFDQLSQARDADVLNRLGAARGQEDQANLFNVTAGQQARTATAQNVSGGAAQLLQQALASQIAGEAAVQQAQINANTGQNQLAALQAQLGQALVVSEGDAETARLSQILSTLQGNTPPAQELVSDVQQTPVGSFSPATGTFTPFPVVDQATVEQEADARTRAQAQAPNKAAGTSVQTTNATTQQLVAKMLGGQPLTAEEQRVLQTQSFNLNL